MTGLKTKVINEEATRKSRRPRAIEGWKGKIYAPNTENPPPRPKKKDKKYKSKEFINSNKKDKLQTGTSMGLGQKGQAPLDVSAVLEQSASVEGSKVSHTFC